jgi:hypothetical protein
MGRPSASRRERPLKGRERPTGCAKILIYANPLVQVTDVALVNWTVRNRWASCAASALTCATSCAVSPHPQEASSSVYPDLIYRTMCSRYLGRELSEFFR